MLSQLYIKNFALIEELAVDLNLGVTALTGETGAGKSILLDALGLVLGDRGDSSAILTGCDRAEISATFIPDDNATVWQWLQDHDMDDDDQCIVRRILSASGKSRGYINGRPASMQTLREVGQLLVDIHGQHEHYTLMQAKNHRALLDSMLPNDTLVKRVADSYRQWSDTRTRIDAIEQEHDQRTQRIDMLRFQTQEFASVSINADELDTLEDDHHRMANAGKLRELGDLALRSLEHEDSGAVAALVEAARQLNQLQGLDDSLKDCVETLDTATVLVNEATATLTDYINSLDIDPARLQWLDNRLSELHGLAKKHQCDIKALADVEAGLNHELTELTGDGHNREALETELTARLEVYRDAATKLHRQRQKAAKALSKTVSEAMHALGMEGGQFVCEVSDDKDRMTPHGSDQIKLLVTANPGIPPGDIAKVASGGELSRISLAIALSTTRKRTTPSLVFDEVDSGIGGGVAETVGEFLRSLGKHSQVLCVTHLPQVASKAHHHIKVVKSVKQKVTRTSLKALTNEERVVEIARMLGGKSLTEKTRQHAVEMLDLSDA